jgi:hypothetical protein
MYIYQMTNVIIIPILSIIGLITNILSIIVFSSIIKNEQRRNDMYKYLLLKSVCEMMGCFFSTFYPLYFLYGSLTNTFMVTVWLIWFRGFIIPAFFMASNGFEIAATFNCAISIENNMKWCEKRLSFCFWAVSIIVSSFGVEIFKPFMYSIEKSNFSYYLNKTLDEYEVSFSSLISNFSKFGLAESIIKEVFVLVILLSLNCYILFKLIKIGRRKKRLNINSSNVQVRTNAEMRKIVMIIFLFITFVLGHLPNFMWFTVHSYFVSHEFLIDFLDYGDIFLYFSYSTSFFVYFAFNINFRRIAMKIIHFRSFG